MERSPGLHRVYMQFMLRDGWRCQFLQEDLKTPLPRRLRFSTADKVRELVSRSVGQLDSETRQALEYGIELGRGGIWLDLTDEQYRQLNQVV